MTCIVGYIDRKNNNVVMGADSAGVAGLDVTVRKDVKVFRVKGFVIGCTSSFRMIQLLRFSLVPPPLKRGQDLYAYMCTDFVSAVRKCFKKGGFLTTKDGVDEGGEFLVAYKNRLFKISEDYQVGESYDDFDACGCGESYAKAALMGMPSKVPIERKVERALEIATHFSAGVRPPFVIETT